MRDAVKIERITSSIGAVVSGIDLRQPLDRETGEVLCEALALHGVMFLRGQDITTDQYWRFMENFGPPMKEEVTGQVSDRASDVTGTDLSITRRGTSVWHADTTSMAEPPAATALLAIEVPDVGGDTCWSSMYAAWEGLSLPMQRMLDGLSAVHSIQPTYERMREYGMSEYAPLFEAGYSQRHAREQIHPVVITHPQTGRKALYVSECFTSRIVELEPAESAAVLSFLFAHVSRPEFTMRWRWSAHDLALWDNRCVQHYAVPDYETSRVMKRIVIAGERPGASGGTAATRTVQEA